MLKYSYPSVQLQDGPTISMTQEVRCTDALPERHVARMERRGWACVAPLGVSKDLMKSRRFSTAQAQRVRIFVDAKLFESFAVMTLSM